MLLRALKLEQPSLGLQPAVTSVSVQFAIRTDHPMAGDHQGHGVGGIGASHCAGCPGIADLRRDLSVSAYLSIRYCHHRMQGAALEIGREDRPVNRNIEGTPLAVEILRDLASRRLEPGRSAVQRRFDLSPQLATHGSLKCFPAHTEL